MVFGGVIVGLAAYRSVCGAIVGCHGAYPRAHGRLGVPMVRLSPPLELGDIVFRWLLERYAVLREL